MIRNTLSGLGLLALAALAALACEPAEDNGEPAASPDGSAAENAPVALASVNRSGVTGQARLERDSDEVDIRVDLEGLLPGARYAVHVLEGRCADEGEIVVALGEAVGSQRGAGRVSREVAPDLVPPGRSYFIQVHDADGDALACGDLDGRTNPDALDPAALGPDTAGAGAGGPRRAPEIPKR